MFITWIILFWVFKLRNQITQLKPWYQFQKIIMYSLVFEPLHWKCTQNKFYYINGFFKKEKVFS